MDHGEKGLGCGPTYAAHGKGTIASIGGIGTYE